MADDNPILSIYVATYNHEKYIAHALDSIRMQKTQYTYEVLVGEDCSTDRTRKVLQDYEKENPDFVQVFYREHNMHKEAINNGADLKRRCNGKYVIALEGDDYWLDPYKIEKQVSFLENNPEYLAIAHNCTVVNEDSVPVDEEYPECKDTEYTLRHYQKGIFPGQLTTVMMRNYYKNELFDTSFLTCNIQPGDKRLYFTLVCNGKIYCAQEKMSAYRHVTQGGNSYSANVKHDFDNQRRWYLEQLNYAYRIENDGGIKCSEYLYLKELLAGVKHRDITLKEALCFMKSIRHIGRSCIWLLRCR